MAVAASPALSPTGHPWQHTTVRIGHEVVPVRWTTAPDIALGTLREKAVLGFAIHSELGVVVAISPNARRAETQDVIAIAVRRLRSVPQARVSIVTRPDLTNPDDVFVFRWPKPLD